MADTLVLPLDVRVMNWVASTLFVVACVLGLGAGAWWVARHPAWTLAGITIEGDVTHQNVVTVRAHLASSLHGSFLTLNLQDVQKLLEDVPWVRQAVVQRTFPNRLTVTLEEHRPVAWWGEAASGRLVNDKGEVFEATADDSHADEWSELVGPDGQSERVYAFYQQLQPVFDRIGREVHRLELTSRGSWRAELDNGARIEMGRGDNEELLARVHTLVATATQLTHRYGGRDIESADLRYPNGYAVRLRGVTTLTEDKTGKPRS